MSVSVETTHSIATPARVDNRLGALDFVDFYPSRETSELVYDHLDFAARPEEGFAYYPGSQWCSALFVGGYQFLDPPPKITADGAVPAAASDGARKLDSRTNFFYMAIGITPAMQTVPGKGWWIILRLYNALQPFFDKSWRPCEIEVQDFTTNGHAAQIGR